jgi:FdhD protein|tara:strand:+ start:1504 stop:2328 length:825 start_codon:yes stop_codon:yes gene_type:complete
MNKEHENKKIKISNSGLSPTNTVPVYNHLGETIHAKVAGELPLTIKINNTEIITLMTLGTRPEELTLGYLRNQGIINNIDEIISIDVKWDIGVSNVITKHKDIKEITDKLKNKTVTTGCGQGTIFSCTLDKLYDNLLPDIKIKRSEIFDLLAKITKYNDIYKEAGAVHGCALCDKDKVIEFVEDVGRHNAADTLSGIMWLNNINGKEIIFYTTGRLTSEIIMKAKHMGIPIIISRSGVTNMGIELAKDLNVTMIARTKQRSFLIYNNKDNIIFD